MKDNSVTLLNRKLFDLLDSFPRATWELLDFHYKTYFDKYINTIENSKDRTLFVFKKDVKKGHIPIINNWLPMVRSVHMEDSDKYITADKLLVLLGEIDRKIQRSPIDPIRRSVSTSGNDRVVNR